jgi:hypothetical protein
MARAMLVGQGQICRRARRVPGINSLPLWVGLLDAVHGHIHEPLQIRFVSNVSTRADSSASLLVSDAYFRHRRLFVARALAVVVLGYLTPTQPCWPHPVSPFHTDAS